MLIEDAPSKRQARRTIAIAGGGIAGLTAALAFARFGYRVTVFEKQNSAAGLGAGIQISPNAYRVLDRLDLSRQLKLGAFAPDAIIFGCGRNGKRLNRFDLGAIIRSRHDAPYLVIHRADLLQVLLNACEESPEIEIAYSHAVIDATQHANGMTLLVRTANTIEEFQAQALIGADGVWSDMRKLVPDAAQPEFSGTIAWRALVPMEQISKKISPSSTGLWLGEKAHIVHYPIRGGSIMNVVAVTPWGRESLPASGWETRESTDLRIKPFEKWHALPQTLVRAPVKWGGWPLHSVSSMGPITNGPLCLIGDAAHPMLPFAAQGGASAIEDAYVLASMCSERPDELEDVFEVFETTRRKRINQLISLARRNKTIYHLPGAFGEIRDMVLKFTPQERLQKRMDWIFEWTV